MVTALFASGEYKMRNVFLTAIIAVGFGLAGNQSRAASSQQPAIAPECRELAAQLASAEQRISSTTETTPKADPQVAAAIRTAQNQINSLKMHLARCNAAARAARCEAAAELVPRADQQNFYNDCLRKYGISQPPRARNAPGPR